MKDNEKKDKYAEALAYWAVNVNLQQELSSTVRVFLIYSY